MTFASVDSETPYSNDDASEARDRTSSPPRKAVPAAVTALPPSPTQYASVASLRQNRLQIAVRGAAHAVADALGAGVSESVYRDALVVELQRRNVHVCTDREVVMPIRYWGRYVGFCRSDVVLLCTTPVGGTDEQMPSAQLIVELKAQARSLSAANVQQLLTYLRLADVCDGMLINFDQRDTALSSQLQQLSKGAHEPNVPPTLLVCHRKRPQMAVQCVNVKML